jgi:hypothetical protein
MSDAFKARSPAIIAIILVALLLWLVLGAFAAFAQSSESRAESGSRADVEVTTGAAAGAQIINNGQRGGRENRTYAEVATAPSLGGLALGGGHPCAYSPATAQISIIGGGAGIGGSKVDSACMLMVMGAAGDAQAYEAAQLMLAARDPEACAAMEAAGMVDCLTPQEVRQRRAAAAGAPSRAQATPVCILEGRTLRFRPSTAQARDAELAACKTAWGVR